MMKKLLAILVLGLTLNGAVNAENKWPNYLTKEIPVRILNKFSSPEKFYNEINKVRIESGIDLNNPKVQSELVKVMVQTLNANIMIGNLDVTDNDRALLESLLKKYTN